MSDPLKLNCAFLRGENKFPFVLYDFFGMENKSNKMLKIGLVMSTVFHV